MNELKLVTKAELGGARLVGPIAEGETPLEAVTRTAEVFGGIATRYAYLIHDEPLRGENQQFPVIIGTFWAN